MGNTIVIKRQNRRYLVKLPVEISSGHHSLKGTTIRISERGLFVRSQKGFRVGIPVDITLHLTEDNLCRAKGIIRYVRSTHLSKQGNGMGIEFTETSYKYQEFIKAVEKEKG
ncbi:MAG TPA: PilZ domain-containing protein [Thermodesulfovibrionales bacterium]|jgi:Tfp pilus assembly protein PilZ|nr:PilZ domain-containing protein [Thermodesulfovibrionales bacterium]